MPYPRAEQETVLVYEEATRMWTAYSCVPKHIRKLASIAEVTPIDTDENDEPLAVTAKLSDKQVRMVAEKVYTEEQREQMRERARNMRQNQRHTSEDFDGNDKR